MPWRKQDPGQKNAQIRIHANTDTRESPPDAYLCLACCSAFLLRSSSSLLLASSSWVRGLGAGLGGIAGSWMKGCEGWTWADDELGRAGEEGLFRSWAETQGCTAPGRSTEVGRGDSLLVAVLLELLVLPLENKRGRSISLKKMLFFPRQACGGEVGLHFLEDLIDTAETTKAF